MGGMIAQALAVLHPAQVRRLVLCATYPGTGAVAVPSQAAIRGGSDSPANQVQAHDAFKAATAEYPAAPHAPVAANHTLDRLIPRARLVLYPDAGHGFLFQDETRLASLVESFLTGHQTRNRGDRPQADLHPWPGSQDLPVS